jgi:hypothetical protein
MKGCDYVPLCATQQSSRNEKDIQTAMAIEIYILWQNLSIGDFIRKKNSVPAGEIRPLVELTPHKKMGNSYATKAITSPKGILYLMAVTERVWAEVVIPPGEVATWNDDLGRLNDLLTCLRYGIKMSPNPSTEINFQMDVVNNDREPPKTITLKATCGPGDNLEPVITVMFPDED